MLVAFGDRLVARRSRSVAARSPRRLGSRSPSRLRRRRCRRVRDPVWLAVRRRSACSRAPAVARAPRAVGRRALPPRARAEARGVRRAVAASAWASSWTAACTPATRSRSGTRSSRSSRGRRRRPGGRRRARGGRTRAALVRRRLRGRRRRLPLALARRRDARGDGRRSTALAAGSRRRATCCSPCLRRPARQLLVPVALALFFICSSHEPTRARLALAAGAGSCSRSCTRRTRSSCCSC